MVHFVGAGPGAADLITLRGLRLLRAADVLIYAGSLVNPALLDEAKPGCALHDSACTTLEQVLDLMRTAEAAGKTTVRLHSGDPSLYGTLREQAEALDALGIPWDVTPGVSSFCAAAAALGAEYTTPGVSQSVILTRLAGRTAVPDGETLSALASHGASIAVFLSAGMAEQVRKELLADGREHGGGKDGSENEYTGGRRGGGYGPDTPAAIVYRASWPEEKIIRCTVDTLPAAAKAAGIHKTALILVGNFLSGAGARSRLYDPSFSTGFRQGTEDTADRGQDP